jgi:hypothetical protein
MKTLRAVRKDDCDAFLSGNVSMWFNESTLSRSSIYFTSKLQIMTRSDSASALKLYSMNLDDFFGPYSSTIDVDASCLVLLHSIAGHCSRIVSIAKQNTGVELVATLDESGVCKVWLVSCPSVGVDSTNILSEFASFSVGNGECGRILMKWLPFGMFREVTFRKLLCGLR